MVIDRGPPETCITSNFLLSQLHDLFIVQSAWQKVKTDLMLEVEHLLSPEHVQFALALLNGSLYGCLRGFVRVDDIRVTERDMHVYYHVELGCIFHAQVPVQTRDWSLIHVEEAIPSIVSWHHVTVQFLE